MGGREYIADACSSGGDFHPHGPCRMAGKRFRPGEHVIQASVHRSQQLFVHHAQLHGRPGGNGEYAGANGAESGEFQQGRIQPARHNAVIQAARFVGGHQGGLPGRLSVSVIKPFDHDSFRNGKNQFRLRGNVSAIMHAQFQGSLCAASVDADKGVHLFQSDGLAHGPVDGRDHPPLRQDDAPGVHVSVRCLGMSQPGQSRHYGNHARHQFHALMMP